MTGAAFEVLDALGGFASLVKRSPTLDGAVPVRVAQGCLPLLEGNALGYQVVLEPGLRARSRLGRVVIDVEPALGTRLAAATAGALPRLIAQGFLRAGGAWHQRLRTGIAWVERGRVRLWTGLLVRPLRGVWLRVSGSANRRNAAFDVAEVLVGDDDELVPLVLDLALRGDDARVQGEVATIVPLRPGVRVREATLAGLPALGQAHADFYDAGYFAAKKGSVTRKYRRLVADESASCGPSGADASMDVVRLGTGVSTIAPLGRFLGADATAKARPDEARALEQVTFSNTVEFRAAFDGQHVTIEPDASALAATEREVEAIWSRVYGPDAIERDRRALWYLTKYFTPHPPGDPHFFIKPLALTRTPPGWSSLVEGVHGDGYDVLRGVVSTDVFHATPAVFQLRAGTPIRVPAGTPILRVIAIPRDLMAASWRPLRFRDAPEPSMSGRMIE